MDECKISINQRYNNDLAFPMKDKAYLNRFQMWMNTNLTIKDITFCKHECKISIKQYLNNNTILTYYG